MNKTKSIDTYQIKVNRITTDKEKLIPYSKYIKDDYPQLSKVVPKNSILYKVKYKPEIVINEYHQTSNNYNTNINIKTNQNDNFHNNYNFNIKLNSEPKNSYNNDYNKGIYLTERSAKKIHNNIIDNNNLMDEKNNKNQNIFNSKEININQINNRKSDINNYIYTNKNKNLNNNNNYLFSNSKNSNKTIEVHKKRNSEINKRNIFNTVKYNKYQKHKQLSMGLIDSFNKMITEGSEASIESLSKNPNKINKIIFLSGTKIKNFKDRNNANNTNNTNNVSDFNIKDETTIKMEIYRIKLFKEFLKHFLSFYKSYIKKYFKYFVDEIKNKKTIINSRTINNYFIHRAKNPSFVLSQNRNKNNNIGKDIDNNENAFLKCSTSIDYYKINNEPIKNKNSNFKNRNTIPNEFNDKFIYHNSMSLYKLSSNINSDYRNTTPRINKNMNNLSSIKKRVKENKSPSFRIGNRTIINRDISFGKEKMEENELYRDSKELNKKYEQIQRRRRKINLFNQSTGILSNRSVDNYKNTQFDLSNEFNEIKRYIQEIKKDNVNSKRNTINSDRNKNIKINNTNPNDNEELKENKNKINKIMNNKIINIKNEKNYSIRSINGKKYKIMKVNINKNLINNKEKNNSYKNNNKNNITINDKDYNLTQYNKNNIYYSKKIKKENELFSIIVKNINTKDNKIHICIHYYFLKERKKPLKQRYNFLKQSKNISLSILNNIKKEKIDDLNIKVKLSSIKEEELSVHNSKIFDETDNIKTFDNNKNIKQFIEKVEKILIKKYKKNFFYKIKTIELIFKLNNVINNKKKEDENNSFEDEIEENNISNKEKPKDNLNNNLNNNANNINAKVYSKKIGFRLNKKEGNKNSVLDNNKNNFEAFERRIYKLRYKLINYCLYLNKGSIKV